MRRALLLPILPTFALACSQPLGSPDPAAAAATRAPQSVATVAAAAPATAPAASSAQDERDFTVPREKFTDPQRNFEAAKKALLEGYYDPSITEEDLYRAAVAGMLERVDSRMHAWNRLLSPTEVSELRSDLMGEIVGIGVKIDLDPATGYIDVKGTVPGSPAERAGITPPDKIVTVNGKLYKGLGLHDVVADIRGKAGDTVTLSVLRGDKLVSIPVVRQKVTFDVVRGSVVGDGVGLVEIPSFNSKTPGALRDVLTDLSGKDVRALVVDVRGNPGGSFDDAVAAAGELVPAGSTVVMLQKRGVTEPVVAKTTPVGHEVPMAVLVDHETASSAELVTAALQELRHATVVGSRTKGKWTVQTIDDLSNGYALKYTLGIFSSPGGRTFDGTGLSPDVEVDQGDDVRDRVRMDQDPAKRLADDVRLRTAVSIVARPR